MSRPRLSSTSVRLPFLGIDTTWELSREEQTAAWKLLVELVMRTSSADMADVSGSDQEALDNLKSLVGSIRTILTDHGVDTAPSRGDGGLPFATVAVRLLNDVIRPFTVRWTPLLDNHHARRPPAIGAAEWEATQWGGFGAPLHVSFRRELSEVRNQLRSYVFVLARAARTVEFGATVETGGRADAHAGAAVFAAVDAVPHDAAQLAGKPRRHMVHWFDPIEVAPTGWKQMRTKRSGDDRDGWVDHSTDASARSVDVGSYGTDTDGVWFDYIADMGDAFDPTMQVAWTAGRETLQLQPGATPTELPRGELLILGGDEVYPHGSDTCYRNHLLLPYENAFEGKAGTPDVVAIPGNHDWAGGLGPWRRVFCRRQRFGQWATRQDTSWWSARLTGGWWVWGIDTFLDGTINDRQRRDFARVAAQLEAGDQVILCTPVPMWRLREKDPSELAVIEEFVRDLIGARGAVMRVCLSGDSHVFAAYRRRRTSGHEELHITSGGGGAFLHPTHNLARIVPQTDLARADESLIDPAPFVDGVFWPPPSASFTRNVRTVVKAVSDRQSPALLVVLGLLHSLYTFLVGRGLRHDDLSSGLGRIPSIARRLLTENPGAITTIVLAAIVIIVCALGVARPNTAEPGVKRAARRAGEMHGLAHTVGFVVVAVFAHAVVHAISDRTRSGGVAALVAFIPGGVVGSLILMSYLTRVNRSKRVNDNEAFSARHFSDAKHFLRLNIDPTGILTVYLLAIERTRSGWFEAMRSRSPLPPGLTATAPSTDATPHSMVEVARVAWKATVRPHIRPVTFSDKIVTRRVGVSISNVADAAVGEKAALDNLFLQLCDTMLAAGFEVAHGGDHRRGGFVARLGEAARGSIGYRGGRVVNYLTTSDRAATERTGFVEGVTVVEVKVEPLPDEPAEILRARELAAMRVRMTDESLARVVTCGRILGAQGSAPGVLYEAHGSLSTQRPLFLLGGFGGVAAVVTDALRGSVAPAVRAALDADEGYVRRLAALPDAVPATSMLEAFTAAGIGGLHNGLDEPENSVLLSSTNRAEIVRLIMKGLRTLAAAE